MADIDLHGLDLSELRKLEKAVAKAIATFEERQKVEAKAEVETLLKKYGYTLADLVDGLSAGKRAAAEPKYQHPESPGLTWSGRGRKPAWIVEGLAAGKTLGDFAI